MGYGKGTLDGRRTYKAWLRGPGRAFVDHTPKPLPQNQTSRGIYPPTALPRWLRIKIRPLAPWWFHCPGGQRMASGGGRHSEPSARQWTWVFSTSPHHRKPQPSLAALSTLTKSSCLGLPRAPLAGVRREPRGTGSPGRPLGPAPQRPPRSASLPPRAWRSWGQITQRLSFGLHQATPRHLQRGWWRVTRAAGKNQAGPSVDGGGSAAERGWGGPWLWSLLWVTCGHPKASEFPWHFSSPRAPGQEPPGPIPSTALPISPPRLCLTPQLSVPHPRFVFTAHTTI